MTRLKRAVTVETPASAAAQPGGGVAARLERAVTVETSASAAMHPAEA